MTINLFTDEVCVNSGKRNVLIIIKYNVLLGLNIIVVIRQIVTLR